MCQIAGLDIDRLAQLAPSKFMAAMEDQWPGVYEHLYAKGFQTVSAIIAELRRQSGGCEKPCTTKRGRKIGKEAAAQNDA